MTVDLVRPGARLGFAQPRQASARPQRGLAQHGLRAFTLAAFWLAGAGAGLAQSVECGRLQAQLATLGRGSAAQSGRYAAAANKQQGEAERMAAYAQSIGCNNRQFLIFGSAPPPQCGGIQARIQQLRGAAAGLAAQARALSGETRRQELQARFDASCRGGGGGGGGPTTRGLFDSLFGRPETGQRVERYDERKLYMPLDPPPRRDARSEEDDDGDSRSVGGSTAVCVRTCDGGFFPVSYSARRRNLDDLGELCKALCPNTEAAVYTYQPSRDIDSAVSSEGDAYASLRNAGKYRTKFDPTCTCKPPNQSWVEALANAEALLGRAPKSDILVTPEKSEQMARPKGAAVPVTAVAEPANSAESATGTALSRPKKFGLGDGLKSDRESVGGEKKPVRVIAPNL